ncbi:hypothetical protein jaqu_13530 [Jannaschia aquimarina]|uniref:PRC-barrel domain protein n=2 Tax=Jannaschia aquimarina TaxID=935700 RepID=A0A0D1EIX4_9RHOB|nr:hypothetical protein jaqu_13530 [Jannaschia aquimarina]SNT12943.1 hypothetical protein SAMN05421775_10694 [Jannaschia aquimarina]
MKLFLTSTAIVLAASGFAQADNHAASMTDDVEMPPRAEGVMNVTSEGSGLTTQAPTTTQVVPAPGGVPSGTYTSGGGTIDTAIVPRTDPEAGVEGAVMQAPVDVPDLDDGTVVANPQTPATAVISDGQVETPVMDSTSEAAATGGADEGSATVDPTQAADSEGSTVTNDIDFAASLGRDGDIVQSDTLTLPQIEGVDVRDSTGEIVGEIGYTVNGAMGENNMAQAVVDIGGFLGLGEHSVLMPLEEIVFLRSDGGELEAYIDMTREELEAMPEYEG